MSFERTIKVAFDKISGDVLEADEIFNEAKEGFQERKKFHQEQLDLYCCECKQRLAISGSKYDRLHFKHYPGAKPCILKDSKFSPHEIEKLKKVYRFRESNRHKELKRIIGERLSKVNNVHSIQIDDKFIIDDKEKKRPDVFCHYSGQKLAFEIQLSDLPLRYILSRYEFYKRNQIYLIWILDDFDVHGQSQTERDIKYLTEFENFFKLDETTDEFRLLCTYKYPYLDDNNELMFKWIDQPKSVNLNQIKFSTQYYQIYYYNFGENKELKKAEQRRIDAEIKEEERRKREDERRQKAERKVKDIVECLRTLWTQKSISFDLAQDKIDDLDFFELLILNESKPFTSKKDGIHHWFKIAEKEHHYFLDFMLQCEDINLEVNKKSSTGNSLLYSLFENDALEYKLFLLPKIMARGYKFIKTDEELIQRLDIDKKHIQSTIVLCNLSNKLSEGYLVRELFRHESLFCTIESAKRKEITGFGYKPHEWLAFANNAIHSYKQYWDYIEIAFKHFSIWDMIIEKDHKGTFHKKLRLYYNTLPEQNYDCDELFRELYPEIEY